MKLYKLPDQVKNGIENESLRSLQEIKEHIVVIGGWAARAHGGDEHIRYTFDIDGIADERGLDSARRALEEEGFSVTGEDWGFRATIPYEAPEEVESEPLKIKVEISKPRIHEIDGSHYFEFDLKEIEEKEVVSMDEVTKVNIQVPSIDYFVANKLGLPPLFKNMYDGSLLVLKSDVNKVTDLIKKIDDWDELAQTRTSKTLESLRDGGSTLHRELAKTGETAEILRRIEKVLDNLDL